MLQGSCISGVVGTKMPKFCLIGDVAETAARMEKRGTPDCIHASEAVVDVVPDEAWVRQGQVKDSSERQTYTYLLHV